MHLKLLVFNTYVKSKASASCEVWGVHPTARVIRGRLAQEFRKHMKILCRLPSRVPDDFVHAELDCAPIEHDWLVSAVKFWNKISQMPANSLHRDVLLDNLWVASSSLVQGRARTRGNSTTGLWAVLEAAGQPMMTGATELQPLDVKHLLSNLDMAQRQRWQQLDICPRTCPTDSATHCTYWRWFARNNHSPGQRTTRTLYYNNISATKMRRYMRFRLSQTLLPVVVGRRAVPAVPRLMRHCQKCTMRRVGDQQHVVFECPFVQSVRDRYLHLFAEDRSHCMLRFMNQRAELDVVNFVIDCSDVLELD